jgi:RNA polymerase sigma-70 factor (ECF subfamily)
MPPIAFKELPDSPLETRGLGRGSPPRSIPVAAGRAVSQRWLEPVITSEGLESRRSHAAELYREYGGLVYRRCLRLLKHPEAARDATQEVFAKLVRDLRKLEAGEASLRWLYCVATNHCLNYLRDQRRRGEEGLDGALEISSTSGDGGFDRVLALSVLSYFDVATRAVAVGVLVDGMEYEEVAAVLGVSKRTVSRKLAHFLATARELVAAKGTPGGTRQYE